MESLPAVQADGVGDGAAAADQVSASDHSDRARSRTGVGEASAEAPARGVIAVTGIVVTVGELWRAAGGMQATPGGGAPVAPRRTFPADRQGASSVRGLIMMFVSARSRRMKVTGGCPIFFPSNFAPHDAAHGELHYCYRPGEPQRGGELFAQSLHTPPFRFCRRAWAALCRSDFNHSAA